VHSEQNPWTRQSSRLIYDNPWISLREDQVVKPSGGQGIYGVVSFKNYAIGIIPVDDQDNTWLIGQYRYTLDLYSWEVPMGGGRLEHDPLDSARRELKEETGLIARKWQKILTLHTSNSVTDEVAFVYLAEDLEQKTTEFDDTEVLRIKKVPLTAAIRMATTGEITDAISVAGLLALARIRSA
jgi:8-oxo-dGTP pyrophosphatase MutT (NUDIX family)